MNEKKENTSKTQLGCHPLPSAYPSLLPAVCTTIEMLSLLPFRWPARAACVCVCVKGRLKFAVVMRPSLGYAAVIGMFVILKLVYIVKVSEENVLLYNIINNIFKIIKFSNYELLALICEFFVNCFKNQLSVYLASPILAEHLDIPSHFSFSSALLHFSIFSHAFFRHPPSLSGQRPHVMAMLTVLTSSGFPYAVQISVSWSSISRLSISQRGVTAQVKWHRNKRQ